MRPGFSELKLGEEELAELQLLLAWRRDLVTDQTRSVTRLREALLSLFPALSNERWISTAKVRSPSSPTTRLRLSLDERATSALPPTLETAASRGPKK